MVLVRQVDIMTWVQIIDIKARSGCFDICQIPLFCSGSLRQNRARPTTMWPMDACPVISNEGLSLKGLIVYSNLIKLGNLNCCFGLCLYRHRKCLSATFIKPKNTSTVHLHFFVGNHYWIKGLGNFPLVTLTLNSAPSWVYLPLIDVPE